MMVITLAICIRLHGVGSISCTFPLMDSHDNFGGGGRGERLNRLRETEVERGAKGCLVEEWGEVPSSGLLPLLRPASECKETGQKLTFEQRARKLEVSRSVGDL